MMERQNKMIIYFLLLRKELEVEDFWLIYLAGVELILVDSFFIALAISTFVEMLK